jgi:hypothetical protein
MPQPVHFVAVIRVKAAEEEDDPRVQLISTQVNSQRRTPTSPIRTILNCFRMLQFRPSKSQAMTPSTPWGEPWRGIAAWAEGDPSASKPLAIRASYHPHWLTRRRGIAHPASSAYPQVMHAAIHSYVKTARRIERLEFDWSALPAEIRQMSDRLLYEKSP